MADAFLIAAGLVGLALVVAGYYLDSDDDTPGGGLPA